MNNITEETIKGVAALLLKVRTDMQVKLRHGSQIRARIKAQLKAGEKVEGYRVEWLMDSRNQLIQLLGRAAEEFNAKYPHDRISVADMVDALASAMHFLKND